jgi:hypothetical protein
VNVLTPEKQERSLAVGVRAIEKEQGKRDKPGEPEAQAAKLTPCKGAAVGRRLISGVIAVDLFPYIFHQRL